MAVADQPQTDAQLLLEGRLGEFVEGVDDRGRPKQQVWVDLIREGFGNARDGHYYPKAALEAAKKLFEGAKMYVNHLDPDTQKRLNGMPRDVHELAGRIREVKMGLNDERKPALRARVSISQPWLWQMIEHDPELIGLSINARGRSRSGQVNGRPAKIVEGISKVVSVDWVTEAGAGGKVVSFVEAQLREQGREDEIHMGIEQLTEDERSSEQLEDDEAVEGRTRAHARRHTSFPDSDQVDPGLVDPHVAADDEDAQGRHADSRDIGLNHTDEQDYQGRTETDWQPVGHGLPGRGAPAPRDIVGEDLPYAGRGSASARRPNQDPGYDDPSGRAREADLTDEDFDEFEPEDFEEYDPELDGELDEGELEFYEELAQDEGLAEDEEPPAANDELERRIETRAQEIAREHLREGIARAVETLQERHSVELDALDAKWQHKFTQLSQRQHVAGMIEASTLPDPSKRALKGELYDAFFEAEAADDGTEAKSAEDVLTETVNAKIEARHQELTVFSEARVSGAGATVGTAKADGKTDGGSAPKKAPADERVRRSIGLDE